jgi:putative nucleotidyltransferase with HDIG domain
MAFPIIEHVAAGQFRTEEQSDITLQAFLGTCLGVALVDKTKKAGGLIHILLPEPPGYSPPDFPEKYASTGIPILIRALEDLGCRRQDLEATIAGGALVGPISQMDMGLDIGGRSADIAQTLLKQSRIKTIKSETGGFFTCTLELNLKTGQTRIIPAWGEEILTPDATFDPPTDEALSHTIDTLKPIPQTALKIMRMVQNGDYDIAAVTAELSQDQVLSAQTLKLCNAFLFSGNQKIDTLKEAVLILGQNMLVKRVITAAVEDYYNQADAPGTSPGYSLCRGGLFFHAVGVAIAAEALAQKTQKTDPNKAYTAGLLHDIGKVVLDQFITQNAPFFFRQLRQDNESFLTAELKILGVTHCKTGSILAKKWQFSNALTQVVRHHHLPEGADDHKDLVAIVYLADLLMEKFLTGMDKEKMQTRSMKSVCRRLGLSSEDIITVMDELPLAALTRG